MSPLKTKYDVILLPKSFRVYLDYVVAVRVSSTDIGALDARSLMGVLQLCRKPSGCAGVGHAGVELRSAAGTGFSLLGVMTDC